MALNPAFDTHTSRKLPLAFGYVQGSGDMPLHTIAPDNSRYAICIMGEGEWDGFEMLALTSNDHLNNGTKTFPTWADGLSEAIHFHNGVWSAKNLGNACTSTGFSQDCDLWFKQFPTVTPPQRFSGIAYTVHYIPGTAPLPFGTHVVGTAVSDITNVGIWRTTRCRIFDANGNVIAYQFTCNPAWQIVEAILRYKIKPQQPPIAGLNAAEKACFNWPTIVAFAARNDEINGYGNPNFFFCGIFAADATLTNIMETILRACRGYYRIVNNMIELHGDDARNSVFTLSLRHVDPESVKLGKKDLSRLPNQFVPRYRDLDMPAVAQVVTATNTTMTEGELNVCNIVTNSLSPFLAGDIVTYGGATDPSFNGSYNVTEPAADGEAAAYVPYSTYVKIPAASSAHTTGGYLGTNDARFAERAPTGVQHRSHQRRRAMQAPGLAVQPDVVPVYYDMGNSTFDQTNRVMKFIRDTSLGIDPIDWSTATTSTPVHGTPVTDPGAYAGTSPADPIFGTVLTSWLGPIVGTLKAYLDAVDVNGARLTDVHKYDRITIDDWLSPEFAGDYVVKDIRITTATDREPATVVLDLASYIPLAYVDSNASDAPSDSYQTVPGQTLKLSGFTPVTNPAYTLTAGPCGVLSGSTLTITIPDLVMQLGGVVGTTAYPTFSVAGVPNNAPVVLYVDDPAGTGVGATFGFQAGTSLTSQPAGRYIVLIGTFTTSIPLNVTVGGNGSVLFQPA